MTSDDTESEKPSAASGDDRPERPSFDGQLIENAEAPDEGDTFRMLEKDDSED